MPWLMRPGRRVVVAFVPRLLTMQLKQTGGFVINRYELAVLKMPCVECSDSQFTCTPG